MPTAKIKFTQGLLDPPPGRALVGVAGVEVACTNEDNSGGASSEWSIEDVPNESLVATGVQSTSASLAFTPDVPGGYMVQLLRTDGSGTAIDRRVFQVPEANDFASFLIPPFTSNVGSSNFLGQLKGWAKHVEAILRYLLGSVSSSPDGSNPRATQVIGTIDNVNNLVTAGLKAIVFQAPYNIETGAVITGFAGGTDGRRLTLMVDENNIPGIMIEQAPNSSGSAYENRVSWSGEALRVGGTEPAARMLWPGEAVDLVWDENTAHWYITSPFVRRGRRVVRSGLVAGLTEYAISKVESQYRILDFDPAYFTVNCLIILPTPAHGDGFVASDNYLVNVRNTGNADLTFAIDNGGITSQFTVRPRADAGTRSLETTIASIAAGTPDDHTYGLDLLVTGVGVYPAHAFTRT